MNGHEAGMKMKPPLSSHERLTLHGSERDFEILSHKQITHHSLFMACGT